MKKFNIPNSMNNNKKILVSGGNGQFANELKKKNKNYDIFCLSKKEMNVVDLVSLKRHIKKISPDYFIHAGALTRPMVLHEEEPETSVKSNIIGTANVVLACMEHNLKLIYISTDYVYPGIDGNYSEKDYLKPFTKYGWSKLGGECAVMLYNNHLILRMAMNEKPFPHPKALVDMKKSLIYIEDAAKITFELLDETGIINVGGKSQSVYDFVSKTNKNIKKISLSDINDVGMAKDCSMNTNKLEQIIND